MEQRGGLLLLLLLSSAWERLSAVGLCPSSRDREHLQVTGCIMDTQQSRQVFLFSHSSE